jgi:TatD DNase family protein
MDAYMFIDSHCHLDFSCFDGERETLLQKLKEQKINKLVIPSTHRDTWSTISYLCQMHSNLYYSLGCHPHFMDHFQEDDLQYLETLLQNLIQNNNKQCVALGEIGLDKFANTDMQTQERVFIAQLKIAQKLKLPIILHVVKKQGRVLQLLAEHRFTQGGVYHAFSGSEEVALAFIKFGFKIGVGGVITYPNSKTTKQTISRLPIESLILETDAPDMPLYHQKQAFNTPLNLVTIFESLVSLRSEGKNSLAAQLYKNTESIFSLDHD